MYCAHGIYKDGKCYFRKSVFKKEPYEIEIIPDKFLKLLKHKSRITFAFFDFETFKESTYTFIRDVEFTFVRDDASGIEAISLTDKDDHFCRKEGYGRALQRLSLAYYQFQDGIIQDNAFVNYGEPL